jgi:hypothetical protein
MLSWKTAWRSLRIRAGLPALRMYDLRHHAVTRLLEDPEVSEQTIQEIAGHVSKRIKDRYSHIRMARKREALLAAETKAPPPQFDLLFGGAERDDRKPPEPSFAPQLSTFPQHSRK